ALVWKPDDEPSAYGLVLSLDQLGQTADVRALQSQWSGRSVRIANLGEEQRPTPRVQPVQLTASHGQQLRPQAQQQP
ncbi:hypothetical protein NL503_30045, partial [Klebsiella pneumoniae]|nr:hypothetical protein [Klebsiella pneumoniae]